MEVIVDDSQLSLAIGKKGQNVRLAAKLLGWKIDIKSEEEKRQEVESAMAALVSPGAPISVLVDYGLSERIAEKLIETGVGTIERLGSMTPEQLEEIQDVGPTVVAEIQEAVNAYYSQFEEPAPAEVEGEAEAQAVEEAAAELIEESAMEEAAAVEEAAAAEGEAESESSEVVEQSGRIEDAGSPDNWPEAQGEGPESAEHGH
jgi:N utilization substance protein A